ncbi:MAG: ATP-binding protein, partial [Moraxellaceae bacterium]
EDVLLEVIGETTIISKQEISFLPGEPVKVYADKVKISHVISNLLHNAVKYSPMGVQIEIHCEHKNGVAQVSIKDQGIGIPAEDRHNLFERYYRVQNQSTKHISGFGIGLYLSSEIIKAHQGKIWVESTAGKGSTFYCEFPVEAQA